MMRVVFFDKMRETLTSVGGVLQIQSSYTKINGRNTRVWVLDTEDGKSRAFKQKDFEIDRVEI